MSASLTSQQLKTALALRDLTDPSQGPHAMQLIISDIRDALTKAWGCDSLIYRGKPVVTVQSNYDALGYPEDGASRDKRYTRYVDDNHLLRTQMSAVIPSALHEIKEDDTLLVCPGLAWRRDVVDRLHVGEPHQLDLWRISKNTLLEDDLLEMIDIVVNQVLPGAEYRCNPASHPYTLSGKEVEISIEGKWIELLECGLAHPHVLQAAGLTSYGLAMGMGLDRAIMLRKGINDIRLLRSDDERVMKQMLHLNKYEPVSVQPAARRDISICVPQDWQAEDLGDKVRELLGVASDWVEEIIVLSRTPCQELPPKAKERLGSKPNQDNLLVSIILRHPTRSLPKQEANLLRDRIYGELHQGDIYDWIVSP